LNNLFIFDFYLDVSDEADAVHNDDEDGGDDDDDDHDDDDDKTICIAL